MRLPWLTRVSAKNEGASDDRLADVGALLSVWRVETLSAEDNTTCILLCFRLPPRQPRFFGRLAPIRSSRRREINSGSRGDGFVDKSWSRE